MVIRKACPSPELTLREAAYNMALLVEHEKDAEKKIKRDLYFGVYRSRIFIVITRSTSLLERIKRYIQWLFGSISYKQTAIDNLTARSRRHFVPANEMKAKNEQLESAFLRKNRLNKERLQNVEQELRDQRQANANWSNICQRKEAALAVKEEARAIYERLHQQLQNRETAHEQAMEQKQVRIGALELEVDRLRNEQQRMIQRWRREWDEATEEAKLRVLQARQETQAKARQDIQAKDRTILRLREEIAQLRQAQQTPADTQRGISAPQPQASTTAIAAILGSPQPPPPHQ